MKLIGKNDFHIKTPRLHLRLLTSKDYRAWLKSYQERLPKQNQFDDDAVPAKDLTRETFAKRLKIYTRGFDKDRLYKLAIFDRKSGDMIGAIDLFVITRAAIQSANIGYAIHNQFWGKGYAKEATRAAAAFAFKKLHLHRIEACIDRENLASIAVAKSIGMQFECTRNKYIFDPSTNKWDDIDVFALIPENLNFNSKKPVYRTKLIDVLV